MYNWERRAAENLTNADHMREVRRRMDHEYQVRFTQNQLRRRERERADAEVKREIRLRTPSPPAPQSNKFKTRTYDRPWAQGVSATRKLSCSTKPSISEVRNTLNKGSMSRLPAIGRGSKGRAAELASSSKTPWRASVPLASQCKGPSSPWQKPRSVDLKNNVSIQGKPSTLKRTQSQDTLKAKNRIKAPCGHLDRPNISLRRDPVCVLDSHSFPQPLTSPGRFNTDWHRLPSLQYRPPSPEDFQLMSHTFEGFSSENSSVVEEDIRSEHAYRGGLFGSSADTTPSSLAQSISSECPSSTRTLESALSESFISPLSSRFSSLDILSSDSDGEDRDAASSWQAAVGESCYTPVQWTGSQTSLNHVSPLPNALSPGSLQSQLGREIITPEPLSRASLDSGCSPMPSFIQVGQASVSPSPAVTERVHRGTLATPEQIDHQLPELELIPRWPPPSWLGSERTSEASPTASSPGRHSMLVSRQEEPEETRDTSNDSRGETLSSSEALRPGTSGLMDHLTMALMALHDIRREVAHMQMNHAHSGNVSDSQEAQSAPASDPETLRKIKESLLEESSDEEGDQCRICQSGAASPTNPLLTPCQCSGSLQYIHHDCLKKWIQTKIQSGTTLSAVKTCELCKESLTLDLDDFDVDEFYQRHNHTQVEQGSEELYMLLLLQQRFSALLQVAQSRSNAVSRAWRSPLTHRMMRARGTRGPQRPLSSHSTTPETDT
ncbi:E3 ubiquitin-protein ligase MARCHF7-like isoform X3 [Osmerus eperlanus]|uniref:E3 ubiquitin-protein ligase MARCHF7-like isoform X3 n=1 Tax=Osmerus eperlanus TaxID=29151 RepID=UPI002E14D5A2